MSWQLPLLVEELAAVLRARIDEIELEQAVRGIDDAKESQLQALLAAGLAARYEVVREVLYPSASGKLSARPRCDLVLTRPGEGPASSLWLELKVAHQLRPPGERNPRYTAQLSRAVSDDLRKIASDPLIAHAAVALILFTDGEETLARDLARFEERLADQDLLAGFRCTRTLPIVDRIGHRLAAIAAWPLIA